MALIRPIQDLDSPNLGESYYEGIVVSNVDPQFLHRVKIRIAELHGTVDDIPDDHLPWAIHFRPSFLGGSANLSNAAIPRVGSKVVVQHIRGDIYQPVYMFELADNSNRMEKAEQNYPDSYVLRDSDDNFWHVDMVDDKLDIKFNGTECIEITVDRLTTIGQNDTRTVEGDDTETITGNQTSTIQDSRTVNITTSDSLTSPAVTINASSNVTINSPAVNVNSGTITVSGGDVIADGISLKGHVHPQGSDGAGDPQVNTNPPI